MSAPEILPSDEPEASHQDFGADLDPDIAHAAEAARNLLSSVPAESGSGNLRPYFSSNAPYDALALSDPSEREINPGAQEAAEKSSDKQRIAGLEELVDKLNNQVSGYKVLENDFNLVKKLAYESAVTGLPNRRKFQETVDERIQHGQPTAVALIDITKFKEVNDRYGHEMGDTVLKEIGALLNAILQLNEHKRKDDQLFHLSGDELAIIFDLNPRKDDTLAPIQRVEAIRTRLRETVDNYALLSALDALGLSIAIGISPVEPGMTGSEVLKAADEAMYRDKAAQYEARGLKPRER